MDKPTGWLNTELEAVRTKRRLEAAAPELLHALKYARDQLSAEDDTGYIDSIIAKAEGST